MKTFFNLFLLLLITQEIAAQKTIADSNYILQDSVPIPSKSGAIISAIILRKKENSKPVPAVLVFTTYNQGINDTFFVKRLVDRGYAGVVAYSRGIKTNIDQYDPYENDGDDAYDVIDWISKQNWCNGKNCVIQAGNSRR
jgi:predicted acyl esterase